MNKAPQFLPYPLAQAPAYSRWLGIGAALLIFMIVGGKWLLSDFQTPKVAVIGALGVLLLWLLMFLLRVLAYRINRHNANCYTESIEQVQRSWWARHRQTCSLIDSVLLGPGCNKPEHRQGLFSSDCPPPKPTETPEGKAIRLSQVFGADSSQRELQLAVLLALQWREQKTEAIELQPLRCYWQGTFAAWQAFVEQIAKSLPQVHLPEQPEPWQGIDSLGSIIDQLQGAPTGARILCAGCQSLPIQKESRVPAGEGSVLWLLASQGGVRFSRGEWYAADVDNLSGVAERVLQQSKLDAPPSKCVSFSKPELPGLSDIGWNIRQHQQDAHFGALDDLEAMVAMTLAASYVESHGQSCAWLARDPHHTLALGAVEPQ